MNVKPRHMSATKNISKNVSTNEEFATGILDGLSHAVIVVDGDDRIIYANLPAEHFFQASKNFILAKMLETFLPFGSPVLMLAEQARRAQTKINEYRVDLSSPRLGSDILVDVHAAPFFQKENAIILEFSHRARAEQLDRQFNNRSAARSVGGLAAMLAHEIKNPLSGIRGAAQLLEMSFDTISGQEEKADQYNEKSFGAEEKSLTRLIRDETDRIVSLVDRMEIFSDERPVEKTAVNIHDVLEHVRKLAKSGFAGQIEFIEDYDPSLPPVHANRDQLIQVFLNLVKNAAEACAHENSGKITLSTGYRPGMYVQSAGSHQRIGLPIELLITDNGSGIREDILPHIFDPFVTTKTNGSGLGLALVAKIIGDHGGMIECEHAKVGGHENSTGTTFRILLPVYENPPPEQMTQVIDGQIK